MRNLIEKLLARFGWPTRAERDDLARQLDSAQAFARQVADALADKAVVVGADGVVLQNLMLDRAVLILPGVRGACIRNCYWSNAQTTLQLADTPKG